MILSRYWPFCRVIITCVVAILLGCHPPQPLVSNPENIDHDIVTVENSPQFERDRKDIDRLLIYVWGREAGGYDFKTNSEKAVAAHALLKELLASCQLRRSFHSRKDDTLSLERHCIVFYANEKDQACTFVVKLFSPCSVELEFRPSEKVPKSRIAGAKLQLCGETKVKYLSLLADLVEAHNPKAAQEFRRKAADVRRDYYVSYLIRLGFGAFVILILTWLTWNVFQKVSRCPSPTALYNQ